MKIKFNIVSNQFRCYKNEICQHLELSKNQSNVIRTMLVFHGQKKVFLCIDRRGRKQLFRKSEIHVLSSGRIVDHIVLLT